ncbi:leucine-rich repeat and IQ domain-containing protein 1 [Sorex araneus]|uniref:leucine-rich repeat and IQ domain-containing protein 1 n=1 Tax=Sorex araneus TaxID=42254 RepID=UPI002433B60F|nr:leucine-rich repeat and IQ domain-containing protein 1 [Sorex araneus]
MMMNDNDDEEAKLNEEIEAELEKISISSLEKYVDSDSKSETQSNDSDSDLIELPDSILHSINTIKQKSSTAEELILQDLEDTDDLDCNYGTLSNDHMHLRIELPTGYKENPRQLMKILAEIEKEEFMRSNIHCDHPDSILESCAHELPMDEHTFPDDLDINFGYYEVEEKCRQSFEAWQDKQKELEDQKHEILKIQSEKEKRQFQEEEEKRYSWMRQFEIEKKKLEDIYKQEQNKINEELHTQEKIWKEKFKQHEEFIRNLNLQMEEERTRFKDLQEKEKIRLFKVKHNAAVKIQATYKAFVVRRKYGPIIREQLEIKKRKAEEWKEKEAKIRKIEEAKSKRLEEKQRIENEIRKQKDEERIERVKEYEEKKNLLRQEKGQLLNKERVRFKEDTSKQLMMSRTLKQGGYSAKYSTVMGILKDKNGIARSLEDETSKKWEHLPLGLVEELKNTENGCRQSTLQESRQIKSDNSITSKTVFTEFKMEEKLGNLLKQQCSGKSEYENIEKKSYLENQDFKENAMEQFQLQELKSQVPKKETMKIAKSENMSQETQVAIVQHNKAISDVEKSELQKIIQDNQQTKILKVENEVISKQNRIPGEENVLIISRRQNSLPLKLEKSEVKEKNVIVQSRENNSKPEETVANPQNNVLNNDIIFYTSDGAGTQLDDKINKKDTILGSSTPCNDVGGCVAKNALVFTGVNSPMSQKRNIPEQCHENRAECANTVTCSLPETALLLTIKEKKLAWEKSFKPWLEIFKENQQKKVVKRKRPIKCPVNIMSPLNMIEILRRGPWNTLQQVTTVVFQDLPGCSLSTLAECSNLQFLSLQRCGLTSLDSLSNCKKLKYIDAQENHIETVNCENLENLCVVLLNKNQLTSFHGLDGCINIQSLEFSHNKITRIAGLESLRNLQQLIVNHNQLISTKGLSDSPTIIYLDCSHNNLTEVEGIENCGLLQVLKLQGNYLSELPPLENHVLLRELYLDDNSISTVEAFSSYWLPLLQNISLSQNSLAKITPLFHFISLEKLDVSNNCLSDLSSAKSWFDSCYSLRELSLTGNPMLQEINWRNFVLKTLPALRILNGEMLNSYLENHIEESYQPEFRRLLEFSQSQIRELKLLVEKYITGKGGSFSPEKNGTKNFPMINIFTLDAAESLCLYFKKMMTLSNKHRFAHEQGDESMNTREEVEAQQKHISPKSSDTMLQRRDLDSDHVREHSPEAPDVAEKRKGSDSVHSPLATSAYSEGREGGSQETIRQETEASNKSSMPTKSLPSVETVMTRSLLSDCPSIDYHDKTMAAMVIQAYWRAYIKHKLISSPDSYIKNHIILKKKEKDNIKNLQEQRENAAILIQAVWKGFLLRKKLATALEAIKNEESEEEYEEIDLEDFTFDEAALEKEWLASDSARFPSQTLLLPNQLHWPKFSGTFKCDDTSLSLPSHPAQAWLSNEKENSFSSEHTHLNSRLEDRTLSWTPESKSSRKSLLKSEKEEKISEEWGFKDISTAQQMLKRARKMKATKLRKNLDPTVRLAIFKNNENKVSLIKSPKKAQSSKDSHLEGKEFIYRDTTGHEKIERSKEYTYQWLHTQVKVHETSSRNMKGEHFLPELDPDIRNGGRVQLVARLVSREDTDLDLFSMTSGSALSVKREKKNQAHRHSAGSSSFSIKGVLAPKITNTRRTQKERISFRDNPVQLSGGWGSGKRMTKTSN